MFCLYIFFTTFALLNIITGVFVESSIASAQGDREEQIEVQMKDDDSVLSQLKALFYSTDSDRSGDLSMQEFEEHLRDERVRAHLQALGIDINEAQEIFHLLDLDMSGSITIDEFAFGCMRMRGTAKSVDIATLIYENKKICARIELIRKHILQLQDQVLSRVAGNAGGAGIK